MSETRPDIESEDWNPDYNDWCRYCDGEGCGEENELESDWINFGNDMVVCRFCKGTGKASVSGLW